MIGGAACSVNTDCGAHLGGGICTRVQLQWDLPRQMLLLPGGGREEKGGGWGRCRCSRGWGGSHCNKRLSAEQAASGMCTPDPSLNGDQIDDLIDILCGRGLSVPGDSAVAHACDMVRWKPYWQGGGDYSGCGAYPRASWVVSAIFHSTSNCYDSPITLDAAQIVASGHFRFDHAGMDSCFLTAEYANLERGACAYTKIVGLYAPQALLDGVRRESWFPHEAATKAVNVGSAAECQFYCQRVTGCDFFTWTQEAQDCWMKTSLACPLDQSFSLGAGALAVIPISGPRSGCIIHDGARLALRSWRSRTNADGSPRGDETDDSHRACGRLAPWLLAALALLRLLVPLL